MMDPLDIADDIYEQRQDSDWTPEEKAARIPGLRRLQQVVESLLADAEGAQ